jgi:predicted RNase H-like HicB family nuclease
MRARLIRALCACLFPNIANQLLLAYNESMKVKVIVHEAEEGGYWAEVPSIPGCATQGETFEELLQNLYEAVEGCLSVDVSPTQINESDRVLEIAV